MAYEVPDYLQPHVQQLINIDTEASIARQTNEERAARWVVILDLVPIRDGDKWCFLWGSNIQEGVVGFGDTVENAMLAFDKAMRTPQGGQRG